MVILKNSLPPALSYKNVNPFLTALLLVFSSFLLMTWPLPETIAFRHFNLGAGFLTSLPLLFYFKKIFLQKSSWTIWIFFGFIFWLLIHLLVFSNEFSSQFYELKHVWMRSILAIPIGLALGITLVDRTSQPMERKNVVIFLMLCGFSGTCMIGFSHYIYGVTLSHQLLNYEILFVFYKAKPPFVISAALSLPLAFILIIKGINQKISRWWIPPSLLIIFLCLFTSYFSNTKNGMVIFCITFSLFVINLIYRVNWDSRKYVLGFIILGIIASLSYQGIEHHIARNDAWRTMLADFQVGVDIYHQDYWKDRSTYAQPLNQHGMPVDISTYERTAWFTAGAQLLSENPLGYGLLHHSFGSLAVTKWPDFHKPIGNLRGATHSGWLDFALGLGIPGLLLVLIPLFISWYRSLFQEGLWFSYAAWTIPVISFAYLTTEVAGGHFTELLFFMTAFFCGLTLISFSKKTSK